MIDTGCRFRRNHAAPSAVRQQNPAGHHKMATFDGYRHINA
jgi:hypothetical protein